MGKSPNKQLPQSQDGGPSQFKQSSRKGKRSWRKNIDIQEVSQGLESLREEERVTGAPLHHKKDSELFQIDITGDDKIRQSVPRPKYQLTSTKIISERSAVPAVLSRPSKRKALVSREDKDRLSRVAKRGRRGPFNAIMDPTELGAGSAVIELTEAVKNSGSFDIWVPQPPKEVKDGFEVLEAPKVKSPQHQHPGEDIQIPSVPVPHQGTSYNPTVDSHQSLLLQAHTIEKARVMEVEQLQAFKDKITSAEGNSRYQPGVATGMVVQEIKEDNPLDEGELELIPKPPSVPKTKQQRQKAAKVLAEKRAAVERLERKRLNASVNDVKALRKQIHRAKVAKESLLALKKAALLQKSSKGRAGQRFGKHKVPEGDVNVQLGEDLSENLRSLKPEGNLFRDRLLSMQHRALVEPRVAVTLKRRNQKKVYDNHAWKRFV